MKSRRLAFVCFTASSAYGCQSVTTEQVSEDPQILPIISGEAAQSYDIVEARGLVSLVDCSGVLVAPRVVVTALHCSHVVGASVAFHEQWRRVSAVHLPEGGGIRPDIVALELDEDFESCWTGGPFERSSELGVVDLGALAGQGLTCFGRGPTSIVDGSPADNVAERSYFSGVLTVEAASGGVLRAVPGPAGQILERGDSGGPCFTGSGQLAAINSSLERPASADQNHNGVFDPGELVVATGARLVGIDAELSAWLASVIAGVTAPIVASAVPDKTETASALASDGSADGDGAAVADGTTPGED